MSSLVPATLTNGPLEWEDTPYREDYKQHYGSLGGSYDDYEPAYRYGHELASDARYEGRAWSDAEGELRADWETRHPDSPWQHFKDAVRHAWERIRT